LQKDWILRRKKSFRMACNPRS